MNKIKIITDSTSDLTKEQYEKNDILVIPLLVNMDGQIYKDGMEINPSQIFEKVANGSDLPKTSAVPPGEFAEIFKKVLNDGYDILYTGIGADLSATLQSANIAKNEFPDANIELVDSASLSTGAGLLLLKAAKLRDEGKGVHQIAEYLREITPNVSANFSVKKMDYLYKGGRCSGISYLMGKLLKIRPTLKLVDGKIEVYATPLGNYEKSLNYQLDMFASQYPNIDTDWVFVTHAQSHQKYIDYMVNGLLKYIPREKIVVSDAGAVISSHCGPDTIGILWISNTKQTLEKPKETREEKLQKKTDKKEEKRKNKEAKRN